MGYLPGWLSFQNVVVVLFFAYLSNVSYTMYNLLHPNLLVQRTSEDGRPLPTIGPRWKEGDQFNVRVLMSQSPVLREDAVLLWQADQVVFSENGGVEHEMNLTRKILGDSLWSALEKNRTIFSHFVLEKEQDRLSVASPMVRFVTGKPPREKRYLVKDWQWLGQFVPNDPEERIQEPASRSQWTRGFWKPVASAQMVADWTEWPFQSTPRTVMYYLKRKANEKTNRQEYMPVVYTDQLGLTREKLIQVNVTNEVLPLSIVVGPMSLGRWQFNAQMEEALKIQKQFGASEKDIDDLRHMFTETEPVLLAVTMLVSLVHILFDVLAFKSDISFWQNAKSTKGLSVRTLSVDLISQVIIALYLYEQEASLLVLAPAAVGVLVQLWKVRRAYSIGGQEDTEQYDNTATSRMLVFLAPVVVGYTLNSLVREKHTGFWGWGIGSLASCVYAFGFVMMTPQIFINYKLKSVAHLPWKFFVYKALNTFIDDLFAFIIRMPTLHRMSVFRDDIVFFIYLYQRWIYPVDYKRKHEMAEEEEEDNHKESEQNEPSKNDAKPQTETMRRRNVPKTSK